MPATCVPVDEEPTFRHGVINACAGARAPPAKRGPWSSRSTSGASGAPGCPSSSKAGTPAKTCSRARFRCSRSCSSGRCSARIDSDWSVWANLAAVAGGLAILLSGFGLVNLARRRHFFELPHRVGRLELTIFVVLPALLPLVFSGQVVSAVVTAAANLAPARRRLPGHRLRARVHRPLGGPPAPRGADGGAVGAHPRDPAAARVLARAVHQHRDVAGVLGHAAGLPGRRGRAARPRRRRVPRRAAPARGRRCCRATGPRCGRSSASTSGSSCSSHRRCRCSW